MSTPTVGQVAYDVPCAKKCVGGWYDKDENDCPPCGYPNGTKITAYWKKYTMESLTEDDDTAGLDNKDIPCPEPKLITCPPSNPCCTYGTERAYGTCGQYEDGKQLYRKYANNSPCVGDSYETSRKTCAPCTGGEWEYTCPTCGQPNETTVTATLNKTKNNFVAAADTGECIDSKPVTCPAAADACPADCTGGKWEYTCPTCGYPDGTTVTATRNTKTDDFVAAAGTGNCELTQPQWCPATPPCCDGYYTPSGMGCEWNGGYVTQTFKRTTAADSVGCPASTRSQYFPASSPRCWELAWKSYDLFEGSHKKINFKLSGNLYVVDPDSHYINTEPTITYDGANLVYTTIWDEIEPIRLRSYSFAVPLYVYQPIVWEMQGKRKDDGSWHTLHYFNYSGNRSSAVYNNGDIFYNGNDVLTIKYIYRSYTWNNFYEYSVTCLDSQCFEITQLRMRIKTFHKPSNAAQDVFKYEGFSYDIEKFTDSESSLWICPVVTNYWESRNPAPCTTKTVYSKNTFCSNDESGTYGWPSWQLIPQAVRATKQVEDEPPKGVGSCDIPLSISTPKVADNCIGTSGYTDELTGSNWGEEPYSKTPSEMDAVVNKYGGWHGGTACQDYNEWCWWWAHIGECTVNPGYMLQNCQASCQSANGVANNPCIAPSSQCQDLHTECSNWASTGECDANPLYMLKSCRASCHVPGCRYPY